MSKTEILQQLPKLKQQDRREIWAQLSAMDGFDARWIDEDALTSDEESLLKSRIADHPRQPETALSKHEMLARLNKRLRK